MSLGLGVIGVGDVAQRDYLPELHRLGESAHLAAVCARTQERARDVAERFGAASWTTSYADVMADPAVDIVLNLTPFSLHVPVTLAALEAGKHVYSEKPLATSGDEADEIARLAHERGLQVAAAPSVMVFPQVQRVAEILASGALGTVTVARGHGFGGVPPWEGYISDPSPFFAAGGGPLRDMAVYPLHALTGLLGPVRRVSAMSSRSRTSFTPTDGPMAGRSIPVDVDDNWQLVAEHAGGCVSTTVANNSAHASASPELELAGDGGTVAISLLDMTEPVRVFADGEWRSEPVAYERTGGPDHLLGVRHLIECVLAGNRSCELSVAHAAHVVRVLEAAELSASDGRSHDLPPDDSF